MHDKLYEYCQAHSTPAEPVLLELERATNLRTLSPQMLSGHYQGLLLRFISQMIRPRRILEIGAFTGYASICLAQGLPDGGRLIAIEVNEEFGYLIRTYVQKAGLEDKIQVVFGDAAAVIPTLEETFDLVFLDAGKLDYPLHYELALDKMQPGGFLLADNVLWDGKVLAGEQDPTTQTLRAFNDFVQNDPRVENLLLPIRDGLLIVRKR